MLHLVLFIVYISLILMVVFVERKRPTEALLWVVIMIFLPYFGTILYLVFGSTVAIKLTAIIRKKKLKAQPYNVELLPSASAPESQLSESDLQVVRFNTVYNASVLTCYNKAEFYTIHHDMVGEKLAELLAQKVKEGVEVWVMCDFIANLSTPKKMFQPLVDAGGKVVRVKPYFTHYRSHRKIVSIDQKIAYIGGMNIGKQYANMDAVKNPWRDTQIRLEGACASVLNTYFLKDWLCSIRRCDWQHAIGYINRAKKYDGEYAWIRCRGQLIRDEDGEPCLFAGIMKLMGQQNKIDPLTQLWNHAEFTKELEKNVKENQIEQMAVMLLDIDDFHQINELYERSLGDQVLKTLGQEIQTVLPDNASLYRLEKDCMGIIMKHGTAEQMERLYFAIKESIERLQEWKNQKLNIELSAGCSLYPKGGKTAEEIYKCALFTLQSVKKMGKNQILFYSENIMKSKSRIIELIRQLREDIAEDYRGFYLNFQPQVDAETRKMIGVEALMRWKNRDGDIVSPGEFIPVMEQNGMIYHAGLWMVRESFRACKEWIRIKPDFTISVNISAVQLLEERFLADFYKIIEEEDFPCRNLIVELTESYAVRNMNVFWEKFKNLRGHGIRIAMDDFGTGYSSLEVLKTAPIDIVKIDRAFLEDVLHSSFDATFISFVVAICHEVEIHVCQEGVETEDEYNFLKKMNLDCIQGYYFGKPVTESEITRQLEQGCGEVES